MRRVALVTGSSRGLGSAIAQVAELVAAIAGRLGPVGVLVVNATGPPPDAPLETVAWNDHVAQLDFFVKRPGERLDADV